MKEYTDSIIDIAKHHKVVMISMAALLVVSLASTVVIIGFLHSSNLQVWTRYASYGESFYRGSWVYFINFIIQILIIGVANNIIALKLMAHKGKIVTVVFLLISIFLVIFTLFVSLSVVGSNREAGIWT
jgi:hypothetical protein